MITVHEAQVIYAQARESDERKAVREALNAAVDTDTYLAAASQAIRYAAASGADACVIPFPKYRDVVDRAESIFDLLVALRENGFNARGCSNGVYAEWGK